MLCKSRTDNPLALRAAPFVKGEYSHRTLLRQNPPKVPPCSRGDAVFIVAVQRTMKNSSASLVRDDTSKQVQRDRGTLAVSCQAHYGLVG